MSGCQLLPNPAPFGGLVEISGISSASQPPPIDGLSWYPRVVDQPLRGVVLDNGPLDLSALGCPQLEVVPPFALTGGQLPPAAGDVGPAPYYQRNFTPLLIIVLALSLLLAAGWGYRYWRRRTAGRGVAEAGLKERLLDFTFNREPGAKEQFIQFFALYRLYLGQEAGLSSVQPSVGELLKIYKAGELRQSLEKGELLEYGRDEVALSVYQAAVVAMQHLLRQLP